MSEILKTEDLQENASFKSDLMIDEKFVLLPEGADLPAYFIKQLKEWNFSELQYKGDKIKPLKDIMPPPKPSSTPTATIPSSVTAATSSSATSPTPTSQSQVQKPVPNIKIDNTDRNRLEAVQKTYLDFMKQINSTYVRFATHRDLEYEKVSAISKELCLFVRDNKRYVLRISPSAESRSKDFIVVHSMRSTVLAITIALEMRMDLEKIVELGVTCILHEIGMIKLPPHFYMTDKVLSPAEKGEISKHPIYSYDILKNYNFPAMTQLGVLEHHEKENGQGYPRHVSGDKISVYAKIISVACSFEAITAPRTYKTERTTFDAMVEMLKNPNNQYDATVIKALLFSLSIYPIGAYVYLSSGKIAVVTDVNPENPKNPVVQLVNERNENGSLKTVQTDGDKNKILRVLSKQEEADVVKNIEKENARLDKIQEAQKALKAQTAQNATTEPTATSASAPKKEKSAYDAVDLSEFD